MFRVVENVQTTLQHKDKTNNDKEIFLKYSQDNTLKTSHKKCPQICYYQTTAGMSEQGSSKYFIMLACSANTIRDF